MDWLQLKQAGFHSSCLITPITQTKGLFTVTAQTDILLNRQGIVHSWDIGVGQPQKSGHDSSWLPILYFLSPPRGSALCKIGFVPTINKEREFKWVYTQAYWLLQVT